MQFRLDVFFFVYRQPLSLSISLSFIIFQRAVISIILREREAPSQSEESSDRIEQYADKDWEREDSFVLGESAIRENGDTEASSRADGRRGVQTRESSRRPVPRRRALLRLREFRQHLLLQQRFAGPSNLSLSPACDSLHLEFDFSFVDFLWVCWISHVYAQKVTPFCIISYESMIERGKWNYTKFQYFWNHKVKLGICNCCVSASLLLGV